MDLFAATARLERFPLADAELFYLATLKLDQAYDSILHELIANVPWRHENLVVWGKQFPQPRLIAWYGDLSRNYSYSGIKLAPLPWNGLLVDIKNRIEAVTGAAFNSVLLNYYRDNRDSLGLHSDDEKELGPHPAIASLSLGDERIFVLKHRTNKLAKVVRMKLCTGSLLLMKGETQRFWKHGIAKEARPCGPRVNLTFRQIFLDVSPV
jgi:alkylated DNA repair dioxygenase AlkB